MSNLVARWCYCCRGNVTIISSLGRWRTHVIIVFLILASITFVLLPLSRLFPSQIFADDGGAGSQSAKTCRLFAQPPASSARLGNRMFVHAALLGLSQSVGCRPAVMAAENRMLLSVFQLSTSVVIKTSSFQRHIPVRQLPFASRVSVYVPLNLSAADRKRIVDNGEYVQVTSYFQSWRYFADVEERVRTDFRFQTRVANAVERIVRRLDVMVNSSTSVAASNYSSLSPWTNTTQPEVVRVGIHVRRSDMASENHRRRGYTVADESYIRRAMSLMEERLLHYVDGRRPRSLVYVVATDDEAWARVYVRSSRFPVVFVAQLSAAAGINHDAAVDLAVLAACNHMITTVGTFGWWAAFLAGGLTIYDATFPAPNTEIASDFRAEDYYPPHWIGLR